MSYPDLKITFLGTGTSSGVPMIACDCDVCTSTDKKDKRLRSSIMVQSSKTTIVVDTTPDFRYQMLRANVKHLDAVIFTHPHKDHIAGMDDIRAFNYFTNSPMEIYANLLTEEAIKREFIYIFAENKYPGLPRVNINTIDSEPFVVGDIPVIPFTVYHLKMPVLGFRFGKFTYITDANEVTKDQMEKVKGSETLVINALRNEKHVSHFSLKEALAVVNDLQIPNVYFTHMSHQLGRHEEVNKKLPPGRQLAWDGMEIEVKGEG